MTRPRPPLWLSAVVFLLVASLSAAAFAQGPSVFRIQHTVDRSSQTQTGVSGRVFNDGRADAIDVYVTAEALDAAGKVIASGVSYVGAIQSGSSAAFTIKVPRAAANVRVLVTSFKFGFANQS
jgi:hypothetical protein